MPKPKRPSRGARHSARRTPTKSRRPGAGGPSRGPARGAPGPRPGREERQATVGVVTRRGKHLEIDPLFEKAQSLLVGREGIKPRPGDLVLFAHAHGRRAQISKILGRAGVLRDVLDGLLTDKLPARGFDTQVLAEAAAAADAAGREDAGRVDLRHLFTFTVDPATAKDFDDALSFVAGPATAGSGAGGDPRSAPPVEGGPGTAASAAGRGPGDTASGGTITAYVHIADVAYYVPEGGAVDREALRRGTSVYVATGVEPMLPPVLSNSVCSLQPGVERKAVTVEMEVSPDDGAVRSVRFYRSLIASDERLDYDQLEEIFRGERRPSPALGAALELGRPLAAAVRGRREQRGSLQITSVEPDFHWDEHGHVTAAHPAEELESHRFIEDFMVLANEEVAGYLERERVPTVYRVHDLPDPFNLDRLLDLLSSLDLPTPPFSPLTATPQDIRRVMIETAGWIDRSTPRNRGKAALQIQVLRAQSRAVYQTDNIGHFGLSLAHYCHFTSPIRRYPDLLVHRGLLARIGAADPPTTSTLGEWAEHCSLTEREASRIELTADDITLAFLLRQRLDEEGWGRTFQGQIVSFVRSGAFVLFDRLYQGFLPARELPGDYYELDDLEAALVGRRTGAAFRLADFVDVKVASIDEARGKVDLVLALD